jgi:hypothetical protein
MLRDGTQGWQHALGCNHDHGCNPAIGAATKTEIWKETTFRLCAERWQGDRDFQGIRDKKLKTKKNKHILSSAVSS